METINKSAKNFVKITKRYQIKFSYAGIAQFADFNEVDGVLWSPRLFVNYGKISEIPDVSECKTIDEVLRLIKGFAYNKQAEIYKINGMPIFYYNKVGIQNIVKSIDDEYEAFKTSKADMYFEKVLKPIMVKNKWKISSSHIGMTILIAKDEKGEWDNVRDNKKEEEFEYLCKVFLSAIGRAEDKWNVPILLNLLTNTDEFHIEL